MPAGTLVIVNAVGANYDKGTWGEDAHEWKPERWVSQPLPSGQATRYPGVYSNMFVRSCQLCARLIGSRLVSSMTFGGGSRACMWALRFSCSLVASLTEVLFSGYNMALTETSTSIRQTDEYRPNKQLATGIAIAQLVMNFKFAPSGKDVYWQLAGVISPTVRGSTCARPELPVMVSRI